MALQQGLVTITGFLGSEPVLFGREGGRPACTFRLGSTRYYLDREGEWQQLPTTWITVKAFRTLALNMVNSFHKGEPVIVSGVLGTEEWTSEPDGVRHARVVIEASNAGHDLNYGVTAIRKIPRDTKAPADATAPQQAPVGESVEVLPPSQGAVPGQPQPMVQGPASATAPAPSQPDGQPVRGNGRPGIEGTSGEEFETGGDAI
ncbi:single-stranded DNA-binding protein [Bifidobacterium cuniculi]|uniref:Single-stranded DNA-binding protein n=1 Tax=Bifidobacterium cuniculi TaxID=1688 RepID=A0A087AGL6_9BIFI|nr:single-stranded DNA-binding protein [Bifidobacterium cuniculi]KFI57916.1 single-strand binding protein [Bifidobacterium cuniculi]